MKRKYETAFRIYHNHPGLIGYSVIGPVCKTKEIAQDEIKRFKKKKMYATRTFFIQPAKVRVA